MQDVKAPVTIPSRRRPYGASIQMRVSGQSGNSRKGFFIAFIGNDGSGKSTLARMLARKLSERGLYVRCQLAAKRILIDRLLLLVPRSRLEKRRQEFEATEAKAKTRIQQVWPYVEYMDARITLWLLHFRYPSAVIVFDRYYYDLIVKYDRLGYDRTLVRNLFLRLERPAFLFFLHASPRTLLGRTKCTHNLNLRFFAESNELYSDLVRQLNAIPLDAERPADEVLDQAIKRLQTQIL